MSSTSTPASNPAPVARTSNRKAGTITLFGLVLLNITAVISLNNLPSEAGYGLSSAFYYVFAAVFFLIPVALVAAEMATGWPERGGVFRWVGEAFRGRLGFMVMFLAFVEVCVFLPTSLTFGAVSMAYIDPNTGEAEKISNQGWFILIVVLAIYWAAVFISMKGIKGFQTMAKWGGMIGVFVPVAILVIFGVAYAVAGNPSQTEISWAAVLPEFDGLPTMVLAASVFLMYAGMEMNAVHVKDVKNATRTYPIAIIISAAVTVVIFVVATLVIAYVIPKDDISLTQAILNTYFEIFRWAGIPWAGPVVAIMLAVGVLVNVTTWVVGPSTGLLAVAKAGYLPPSWQKTNKHGMATTILLVQAVIVSLISILFVVVPSVETAYQIMNQMANILYLTIYLLMFASVIRLRYTQPNRPRPFRLGKKGNTLVWIIAGAGFLASAMAFILSFVPPSSIPVGSPLEYILLLIGLTAVFYIIPNVIYNVRKPSWNAHDPDFAPFTWQENGKTAASATAAASVAAPAAQPGTAANSDAGTADASTGGASKND